METTVVDGRATAVRGAKQHPITNGFLCAKVNRYPERTYSPDRVLFPMRRVGGKGPGRGHWVRATWPEALDEISTRLQQIKDTHGPQAILPYSYSGTLGVVQRGAMADRFFHRLGASLLERTICASAGKAGWQHTYGQSLSTPPEEVEDARLILLWGTNTLTSNPHLWPFILKAQQAGARVIAIDPVRTRTARACDEHIAVHPGSDAALALSMMHVLFREGLVDEDFLSTRTHGADQLRERVLGEWSPDRAAAVTGVPADRIAALAREYGRVSPTYIRLNYGLQRHAGGASAVRAISILPAVTGAWRHRGGGAALSTTGAFELQGGDLSRVGWVPPGTRSISMIRIGEALLDHVEPVRALIVYNSNPVAVAPDAGAVRRGFARKDLFTVVLEHFETDTADYADWLLPATTQLEHWDVHTPYGHTHLTLNRPAIDAVGEALPNSEFFRRLAGAMGLTDPEFAESDVDIIRSVVTAEQWEELARVGWVRFDPGRPYVTGRLATPTGLIQLVADELGDLGLDPVPDYVPPAERPEPGDAYPLMLLSPPEHGFMNSTFANIPHLARKAGQTSVLMHPHDAAARSLIAGQTAHVFNDRGGFDAQVVVTEDVRPGVVVSYGVRWAKRSRDGRTVNDTTATTFTDLGRGATFYDNAVEVEARS